MHARHAAAAVHGIRHALSVHLAGRQRGHVHAGVRQRAGQHARFLGGERAGAGEVADGDASTEPGRARVGGDQRRFPLGQRPEPVDGQVRVDVDRRADLAGQREGLRDVGAVVVVEGAAAHHVGPGAERPAHELDGARISQEAFLREDDDLHVEQRGELAPETHERLERGEADDRVDVALGADGGRAVAERALERAPSAPHEIVLGVRGLDGAHGGHRLADGQVAAREGDAIHDERLVDVQVGVDERRDQQAALGLDDGSGHHAGRGRDRPDHAVDDHDVVAAPPAGQDGLPDRQHRRGGVGQRGRDHLRPARGRHDEPTRREDVRFLGVIDDGRGERRRVQHDQIGARALGDLDRGQAQRLGGPAGDGGPEPLEGGRRSQVRHVACHSGRKEPRIDNRQQHFRVYQGVSPRGRTSLGFPS